MVDRQVAGCDRGLLLADNNGNAARQFRRSAVRIQFHLCKLWSLLVMHLWRHEELVRDDVEALAVEATGGETHQWMMRGRHCGRLAEILHRTLGCYSLH